MSSIEEIKENDRVQNRGKIRQEEEDEPMFNDRDRGPGHRITRKGNPGNLGILSYLPSSAKYIFIAMMGMGILCIVYLVIFSTGNSSYKFQNKGKLSTFINSEFMKIYYKTVNKIEEYNVYDIRPFEFFSILLPNGVPVSLAMNKGKNPSDKYLSEAYGLFKNIDSMLNESKIETTLISCKQNFSNQPLDYHVKTININNLAESDRCYYINNISINEKEASIFKNYLYDRMPYLSYLPLQNNKIKVSVGTYIFEEAKWNKENLFLCNLEAEDSTNYPEIIMVSPINSDNVPIYPEGSIDKSFVNLFTATKESNSLHLLSASTCLYIPPFWWYQIKWDMRFKMVQYSFPAPTQLKYIFEH